MTAPKKFTKGEAMMWLFVTTVEDHIMDCDTVHAPGAHPECREKDCPNCCDACGTLRWFRDEQNVYLTRLLNRFGGTLRDWQMADGSVDWSQVEAHWDDSGSACGKQECFEATADEAELARDRRAARAMRGV